MACWKQISSSLRMSIQSPHFGHLMKWSASDCGTQPSGFPKIGLMSLVFASSMADWTDAANSNGELLPQLRQRFGQRHDHAHHAPRKPLQFPDDRHRLCRVFRVLQSILENSWRHELRSAHIGQQFAALWRTLTPPQLARAESRCRQVALRKRPPVLRSVLTSHLSSSPGSLSIRPLELDAPFGPDDLRQRLSHR